MPTQLVLNTNQLAPSLHLEFTDADNNVVPTPDGAVVAFDVDYPQILSATPSPDDQTLAMLALKEVDTPSVVHITVSVTGANDVAGQPYATQEITVQITPGVPETVIPATPPSLLFGLVQTQAIPAPTGN